MRLGKRQQARRVTPPPIQEAVPPPRLPMASYPTEPFQAVPPGYSPDGSPFAGYGPDGSPLAGYGPDGSPIPGYGPGPWPPPVMGDPIPTWGPDGAPVTAFPPGPPIPEAAPDDPRWVGDPAALPPMAYAYGPDGSPVLYAQDAPQAVHESHQAFGPPPAWGSPPAWDTQGALESPPGPAPFDAAGPQQAHGPPPAHEPQPQLIDGPPTPVASPARAPLTPDSPQVTAEPEPVADAQHDAPPWPDFAPTNRPVDGREGARPSVERLPTATQAHRLRPMRPLEGAGASSRTTEARLSRLHLRGGMLALARASLEQAAATDTIDRDALADLAEVLWRSGEFEDAADAAEAHLRARGDEPIARIIAAERAARDGRILDARQLATRVQGQVGEGLERLFAGEPRSAIWPPAAPDWMDAGAPQAGRYGLLVGGAEVADPGLDTWPTAPPGALTDRPALPASTVLVHTSQNAAPFAVSPAGSTDAGHEADRELQAARGDLARGDLVALADRLGLLLRRDPGLAPVILSMAEHALAVSPERGGGDAAPALGQPRDTTQGPALSGSAQGRLPWAEPGVASLQMLRGDILRGLGHDVDATQAYQEASRALPGRPITRESS